MASYLTAVACYIRATQQLMIIRWDAMAMGSKIVCDIYFKMCNMYSFGKYHHSVPTLLFWKGRQQITQQKRLSTSFMQYLQCTYYINDWRMNWMDFTHMFMILWLMTEVAFFALSNTLSKLLSIFLKLIGYQVVHIYCEVSAWNAHHKSIFFFSIYI